jgi:predicted RNA binding protein YcfA (HicA-like mRNA interferase family)
LGIRLPDVPVLSHDGFANCCGSHQQWRYPNGPQVIVDDHGSKPIPIGTLKNIIEKEAASTWMYFVE